MRFGLQKMTLLDFPGKIACTVFTSGCTFRCPFCHNGSLVRAGAEDGAMTSEELLAFLRREPCVNLTVLVKTPESAKQLAVLAPYTDDYPIPAFGAQYYLCRGGACQASTDSLEVIERQFEG